MTQPTLPSLPPDVTEALLAERAAPPPPGDVQAHILGRLHHTLATASAAPSATSGLGLGTLSVAALLAFPVAGYVATRALRAGNPDGALASPVAPAPPAADRTAEPPAPQLPIAPSVASPRVPLAPSSSAARPTVDPSSTRPASVTPAPSLAEERILVDAIRDALRVREPERAVRLWESHTRTWGRTGRLNEEADALHVRALLASGRRDDARTAVRRFAERYPSSFLGPSLARMVDGSALP